MTLRRRSELKRSTKPLRRTELKRGDSQLQRRTRLQPMSDKRRAAMPARAECRQLVIDRARGRCEACPIVRPGARARQGVDVHEILTRARAGDAIAAITDPANCLFVCRPCHDWITEHPIEAEQLGLVRHSWDR